MKKILPFLTIFIIIIIIISIFLLMSNQKKMLVIYENNHQHKPIDIELNHFQDTQCGMTITKKEDSVQAISPDGKTWFFDDIGCLALWFKNIKFQDELIVWIYSRDTKKYIDARKAWYTIDSITEMRYGFAAYESKKDGMITFDEVVLRMYRGENLANPLIRKKILGK